MAMVDVDDSCQFSADSRPKSTGLVCGLAATCCSVYIHQMNRVNSRNDIGHDDSTINIVVAIIIIIIIITQCYLPPDRGDIPAFTPGEAGTRLSDPEGCMAELAGYIPRWYTRPKTVTHPSTNRARRALTSFMRRTPLITTPRRQINTPFTQPTQRDKRSVNWAQCAN